MENKKNEKLIYIIMIIILILLIILTIVNLIILNKDKHTKTTENQKTLTSHSNQIKLEILDKDLINPVFSPYVFKEYKGEYSQNDIVKAINKLVLVLIPKFNKEVNIKNEDSVKEYYRNQKFTQSETITNIENTNVGIQNEKAFVELINKIKNIEIPNKDINCSLEIDKKSINVVDNGIKISLKIQYEQSNEIYVNLLINNKSDNDIIIEVCE